MAYLPKVIDTNAVVLTDNVRDLIELLAENIHDIWARQRYSEGWHYGPRTDPDKREHACLVPYDRLSDTEKDCDRQMAEQTIKAIVALGYMIEKKES